MKNNNIIKEEMRKALVREVATYYVETQATIRKTATLFGMSKSWVHRVLKIEIPQKCPDLIEDVNTAINVNKQLRYSRGGKAIAAIKKNKKKNGGK